MQSRHRVIPLDMAPTDDLGELNLPDDLGELAERLQLEASQLAACYPAECWDDASSSQEHTHRGPTWRAWWLTGGAAACAVLLLALAAKLGQTDSVERGEQLTDESPRSAPANVGHLAVNEHPRPEPAATSSQTHGLPRSDHGTIQDVSPAVFLQNVSGPELEGLLDLWDGSSAPATNVSI